jgi:hypothetical protein
MWSLETVILLIMVHNIWDELLLIEAALVDSVFSEIGLDDV